MIQKFQFFAEILKFCKFQKFLKFNESVVDVDESIQDLTGSFATLKMTMHNEGVVPTYFDCAQHRLQRA